MKGCGAVVADANVPLSILALLAVAVLGVTVYVVQRAIYGGGVTP